MSGLEAAALGAGAKVGEGLLAEGMKQAGMVALKQLFSKFDTEKDPVIFFSLFCSFKELPSFDIASSQLNMIMEKTSIKSQEFVAGKHTYRYGLSWDELEGCEVPNTSWEPDTYAFHQEDRESIDWSVAATCVSGFSLWIFPVSQKHHSLSLPHTG